MELRISTYLLISIEWLLSQDWYGILLKYIYQWILFPWKFSKKYTYLSFSSYDYHLPFLPEYIFSLIQKRLIKILGYFLIKKFIQDIVSTTFFFRMIISKDKEEKKMQKRTNNSINSSLRLWLFYSSCFFTKLNT
jgi:hypothetical protein